MYCNLLDSLLTSTVSSPKCHSSGHDPWAQCRLRFRIRLCAPPSTQTLPHQCGDSTRFCVRPLKQKRTVFNLSQAWPRGWKSPSEHLRWKAKLSRGRELPCMKDSKGVVLGWCSFLQNLSCPGWGSGKRKGSSCSTWACSCTCVYVVFNATSFSDLVLAKTWNLAVYGLCTNAEVRQS